MVLIYLNITKEGAVLANLRILRKFKGGERKAKYCSTLKEEAEIFLLSILSHSLRRPIESAEIW